MKNSFSRVKGNAPYDFLKSDVFSCFILALNILSAILKITLILDMESFYA